MLLLGQTAVLHKARDQAERQYGSWGYKNNIDGLDNLRIRPPHRDRDPSNTPGLSLFWMFA